MKSLSYSHIGKKSINEDYTLTNNNIYIVCDGVGGEVKGELASKSVGTYINENINRSAINKENISQTIIDCQKYLNQIIKEQPELEGMATTLASVFLTKEGIFTAHLGDSRIYLIRPSEKKFWQTWDHSLVGTLVKSNEITREEGRNHPMSNQIFKAIKANFKEKTLEPEIHFITDIKKDDIIFICSDGVSEAFPDFDLLQLLASNRKIEEKIELIKQQCSAKSYDNNSAILCKIEEEDLSFGSKYPLSWTLIESLNENSITISEIEQQPNKKKWFRFF